ncbi:hypothetical protein [Propionimicrobium sp. PCR01-08-3]|uniref:type II secretion system F family protein n=1 Tax=Propionimicrobium sp. PCR01-08-3 TaxID=3052086 RepID=UPI00255C8D55|nr:hypothetical protein [Propionimicrobium sp. PCR01-08-3]WIY82557.1 hypothetical protein QQ658_13795 [Propionimicrobium sp. PCR01-08-3]
MPDPLFAGALAGAALAAVGIWVVTCAVLPRPIRLDDALALLDAPQPGNLGDPGPRLVDDATSKLELFGAWCYQHARLPLPARTARALVLQGRTVGDYFCNKLILAGAGLVMPWLLALALRPLTGAITMMPMAFGLIAAVLGWFWPDLAMRSHQNQTNADAAEAVNTYFDLVILERLANLSATQSLESAAVLSDTPVFVRIAGALEQARLEQRPPWNDLYRLSRELELPAIADMADVMRLDDQGAALADVLGSRAKELRDAHLTDERTRAHQTSERMTLWMSIPVIIFALIFLVPPLLTISGAP